MGKLFIEGVAEVPAVSQVEARCLDELSFGADALEEHDQLQFEEDHRVNGRPSSLGQELSRPVADETEVEEKVQRQVRELSDAGLNATYEEAVAGAGGAAHAIADAAKDAGADVIVVGTRGQGPLSGLLLGSVTNRLLHIAHCPVLAVPPE